MRGAHEHDSNFGGLGPALGPAKPIEKKWGPLDERAARRKLAERAEQNAAHPGVKVGANGKLYTERPLPEGEP